MNEKPERSPAARLAQVTAVVLAGMVIFLSQQVIALKNERQRLLSDADASTRAFTRGLPIPKLPVVDAAGSAATLDQLCTPGAQLVAVFTDVGCSECSEITPLVDELSSRAGVTVVAVYSTSFPSRRDLKAGDPIRRFRSNLSNVVNVAKVSGAPSVILADGRCEISAAGSGLTGSRLVLERVLKESTSP